MSELFDHGFVGPGGQAQSDLADENVRWLTDYCVLLIDADGSRFEIPDIRVLGQRMARMITENLQ